MNLEKVLKIITYVIRISLVVSSIISIFESRWLVLFISICSLVLSFLPTWIEKKFKIDIPMEFEILIILFIYASLFLGEVRHFYEKIWWWDILLHGISAVAFSCLGFIILYVIFKGKKVYLNPFWIALFSLAFALSIGAVWEIFEFLMDQSFGFNMQKSGLIDTMWDLIVDFVGGLIASIAGYFFLKHDKKTLISDLIEKSLVKNKIRIYKKRNRNNFKF